MSARRAFASDNWAGVHPEVLAAIAEANEGHAPAYGRDRWTERATEQLRRHFGDQADPVLVFNGTAANVLCIEALTQPWEAVICASTAHVNVDECGAPERGGRKLLTVHAPDGRLTPELAEPLATRFGNEHAVQPRVVSISQTSELGTNYKPAAIRALADWAHERDMLLHVDGARLTNAAAALDVPLRALTTDVGVDAVSFGGTKAGLLAGETVVLLRDGLAPGIGYLRKQAMQLASKMRFLAAQIDALLAGDLWWRSAAHANAMAARLATALDDVPGVVITQPVESNAVFARLSHAAIERLQPEWPFYSGGESAEEVRWMCAWDTTEGDVDAFAHAVRVAEAAARH